MLRKSVLTIWVFAFTGVAWARAEEPSASKIDFFESKIRPVLIERCQSCHSSKAAKLKGNLRLDSREMALKGGDSGPAILPGKSAESRLFKAVEYRDAETAMPPAGKIPAAEIALLKTWIDEGAVWPSATVVKPGKPSGPDPMAGASHWAWQPLAKVAPPQVRDQARVINEIDRFVLSALEARNLKPSPSADRRTLIRRAYLDLLGLPAPPAEAAAFAKDTDPRAYDKLIDRLLASPQYGERQARRWLDVARFSDGLGGFLDGGALPDAWRYRDWVVQSFNNDLPYDLFVKQQIAGDLLGDPKAAIGTGFLAVGPTYNDDGGDPDSVAKTRAETLDDRVDTVTRAFLGLTVSCARCHDHKFDPIPQADYYSLAGVFNNTRNVHARSDTPENLKKIEEHQRAVRALEVRLNDLSRQGLDPITRAIRKTEVVGELKKLRAAAPPPSPMYHGVADGGTADMAIAIRGDLRKPGAVVPRRFPEILSRQPRQSWTTGSGRLQLAEAMVSKENPLTARVMVNRLWQGHFGEPLVRTPGNFGTLGEKPTHPELLDWLAARFIESGWSIKALHKTIMLSATYRSASQNNETNFRSDGDNRFLWRMSPARLDVETWRDCVLAVTGELDPTMGGPPAPDILSSSRRTLYAAVSRNGDRFPSDAFLRLFDFPSARATVSERPVSTVPQQFLFLLNSPFMEARARAFAGRLQREVAGDAERINRAYELLYARTPEAAERELGLAFLAGDETGQATRWRQYAQVLLGSHEFMQWR